MSKTKITFNARQYMEQAITEMNKSKNEPRPDGKVPPKVGAVLVLPDGTTYLAHRGELREGDHAEFTLIERKLHSFNLEDAILFATLEPCVKRNSPKVPCCRRTTNARIKTVYVGITDPDPTVDGKGIIHLQNNGVQVHMFDRDLQKQINTINKSFITQAIERKSKATLLVEDISILEQALPTANFDELSAEALQTFIVSANLNYKLEAKQFQKYLEDLGVLAMDKAKKHLKPTGFGILLFGRNPRLLYKQASLKCTVNYGNDKIEIKEFNQALVLIPNLVEQWIIKVLPQIKDTSTFKRTNVSAFPIDVLREAVINALVHRDYNIEGAKSYLHITTETIEIKSPGAPLPAISLQQLNSFKAPSISRNPIITYVFGLMHYVEETGFGMSTLQQVRTKYGLPTPQYNYANPFLSLVFPRSLKGVGTATTLSNTTQLKPLELQGYDWLKSIKEASTREYSTYLNIGYKTAQRHLSKFKKLGLVSDNEEETNSPTYKYVLI
jgi:ATP-dependent DNA helicase RecG